MFAPRIRSPLDLIEEEGRRGARAGRRIGCRLLCRDSSDAVRQISSGAEPFRRSRYRRRQVQAKVVEVPLIGTNDTLPLRVDQRRWIRSEESRSDREIGASDSEAQVDGVGTLWSWPIIDIDYEVRGGHRVDHLFEQVHQHQKLGKRVLNVGSRDAVGNRPARVRAELIDCNRIQLAEWIWSRRQRVWRRHVRLIQYESLNAVEADELAHPLRANQRGH